MHSNKENPVEEAFAGHIYAFIGLKDTTTGDTLCDPSAPIQLESMSFPEPVISVAIEPKTKGDQEKLGVAIQKLAKEDPTFQVELDCGMVDEFPDNHDIQYSRTDDLIVLSTHY